MSSREHSAETPNPNRDVDAEAIDLGDDVRRTAGSQNSALDAHPASGLEGRIDAGTTDLGDDVNRTPGNQDSMLGTNPESGLEGGIDPGTTDLGDDVRRTA
ncbi:MAG TPA: hypothetical protein VGD69_20935 [Herpetosiphonaceae bacterium]